MEFKCDGSEHIDVIIHQENGTVILIPEKDWNGRETLTFYADDGLYKVSDQVKITVTPVNDPPDCAKIISPKNNSKINEGHTLDFKGTCNDPDLPYNDKLIFGWKSNISGELGKGQSLDDITLPIGEHLITFIVTDLEGEISEDFVNIIVRETLKSDSDGDGMPNVWEREHGLD